MHAQSYGRKAEFCQRLLQHRAGNRLPGPRRLMLFTDDADFTRDVTNFHYQLLDVKTRWNHCSTLTKIASKVPADTVRPRGIYRRM
jgi:hypothetical protein